MKTWFVLSLLLLGTGWLGASDDGTAVTLLNTLPDRPVFNYTVDGVVQTRALAPGTGVTLAPGLFSGLGIKKLPLEPGATYYMARFGAVPRLYRLADDQILILNQSGKVLELTLGGDPPVVGTVGSGNLALGSEQNSGGLSVSWDDGTGPAVNADAVGGMVYRLVSEVAADGGGPGVSLKPWD